MPKIPTPTLEIKSERKGSNPGGFVAYSDGRRSFEGYYKYCIGSKISKGHSSLGPHHQPVYEALTFELARMMGLKTPDFFVLLNKRRNVSIKDPKSFSPHDPSGRVSYFISKILRENGNRLLDSVGSEIIENERVYLDSLMISDILGKRQNYLVLSDKFSGEYNVCYVDLGCSFVKAASGLLILPNRLVNLDESSRKKDLRDLRNKSVILPDNDSSINLGELVECLEDVTIPTLNPHKSNKLEKLLAKREIDEIRSYLAYGLARSLKGFKERGLLIVD